MNQNQAVKATREIRTANIIIPAGTLGHVESFHSETAGPFHVKFTLPRRYDIERFGANIQITIDVASDEIEAF